MSDMVRVHCRHCGQTYVTTAETTKCDACGKEGGFVDPDVVFAERAREGAERAEKEEERAFAIRQHSKAITRFYQKKLCFILPVAGVLLLWAAFKGSNMLLALGGLVLLGLGIAGWVFLQRLYRRWDAAELATFLAKQPSRSEVEDRVEVKP